LGFADVDWRRTVAYSLGHFGQIYLNVAGRQPRGVVDPGDYRTVRERVVEHLRRLRHPDTGLPLVAEVVAAEAAAHGSRQREQGDEGDLGRSLEARGGRVAAAAAEPSGTVDLRVGHLVAAGRPASRSLSSTSARSWWQMRSKEVSAGRVPFEVEEELYLGGAVPSHLPTPPPEVVAAVSLGGGVLRRGQGDLGGAIRGNLRAVARLRR
jgi:hypothetical protein